METNEDMTTLEARLAREAGELGELQERMQATADAIEQLREQLQALGEEQNIRLGRVQVLQELAAEEQSSAMNGHVADPEPARN